MSLINSKSEIASKYCKAIRDFVNEKVSRLGRKPTHKGIPMDKLIMRSLKLDRTEKWGFLCVAMDLFDDANYAIENILRFKLGGPTKYEEIGERILRLYGFLSAVYLQQRALLTMLEIFKIDKYSDIKKKINKLKITEIRHKLASHPTNFKDSDESINCFIFSHIINMSNVLIANYKQDIFEEVNLIKELDAHYIIIIKSLDYLLEKIVVSIYGNSPEKLEKWKNRIELLRGDSNLAIEVKTLKKTSK